ncbi:MAG: N-acetylglutaminylglutamine synthetase [Hyphomicrobiales bacterium]
MSLQPTKATSLKHWGDLPTALTAADVVEEASADCGWGRLLFGQTFSNPEKLADALQLEGPGRRDIAIYVRDPHVLLSHAPQSLFLDPSHTFRLDLTRALPAADKPTTFHVRAAGPDDESLINTIYITRGMVPVSRGFCGHAGPEDPVTLLTAVDQATGHIIGVVMGVDHAMVFNDPDGGSSLWALAVDPQARYPGIGKTLVLALARHFRARGRAYMDLSVMHDNAEAIALYDKLGFERVPVYSVKRKNPINETLFIGPAPEESFNIYAQIIIDEARRRGISVEAEDASAGLFTLSLGGRSISCRESLSDLTSAVVMSRCDDKALTHRLLAAEGLKVPEQVTVRSEDDAVRALDRFGRIVLKPARGEQGKGVFVDLRSAEAVRRAWQEASKLCESVVVEEFVTGEDLRIIVIDGEVVAAAIRRPATIICDGKLTIEKLIEVQSRRRATATGGESRIPIDDETRRAVRAANYSLNDMPPEGTKLRVRKTANLHTGGTIHDVTGELHPELEKAAIKAAAVLRIPVVGLDFMVPSISEPEYHIIEANERPGLANHEPAPTAEKFIDFLFPQTKAAPRPASGKE